MGVVYKATAEDGRVYIGMTTRTLEERKKQHYYIANKYGGEKYRFQKELRVQSFTWESVFESDVPVELFDEESRLIDEYESNNPEKGFNVIPGRRTQAELLADYMDSLDDVIDKALAAYEINNHDIFLEIAYKALLRRSGHASN